MQQLYLHSGPFREEEGLDSRTSDVNLQAWPESQQYDYSTAERFEHLNLSERAGTH